MGPSRKRGARSLLPLLSAGVALLVSGCGTLTLLQAQGSPEAVATAVVRQLARRDLAALRALAVTEAEFREIVWPALPASRPERNVPWDYAWKDLHGKSDAHLRAQLLAWEDRGYRVVSVAFRGATTDYGRYRVRRESVVTLRDRDDRETTGRLFGSMIEMDGRYKVFSYVVD